MKRYIGLITIAVLGICMLGMPCKAIANVEDQSAQVTSIAAVPIAIENVGFNLNVIAATKGEANMVTEGVAIIAKMNQDLDASTVTISTAKTIKGKYAENAIVTTSAAPKSDYAEMTQVTADMTNALNRTNLIGAQFAETTTTGTSKPASS